MEIKYIGHSCFKIKGKDTSIVIDPFDPEKTGLKMPTQSADILLISHDHYDHNFAEAVIDTKFTADTPGEYEIAGTFIYGLETFHDANKGEERGKNTIFQIDMDGFNLLHLGDLGHELSKETLEKLPDIDILFIPVGGFYTIDAKTASKVISSIEPFIVIPMHYHVPEKKGEKVMAELEVFLDEMGVNGPNLRREERLKLNSRTDIPEETEVIVLKH